MLSGLFFAFAMSLGKRERRTHRHDAHKGEKIRELPGARPCGPACPAASNGRLPVMGI
ncbi:conserved hypothetical protein [Paraburkholderia sacchari]